MKKFAQILNSKVHWIFEREQKPKYSPSISLVEITGNGEVQEGWVYDEETGSFSEPSQEVLEHESESHWATIEEQILAENIYQTALIEMQMLGGM